MNLCNKQGNGICLRCDGKTDIPNTICRYEAEEKLDLLTALLDTNLTKEQKDILEDFEK